MANKVDAARNAVWALVSGVAASVGVSPGSVQRNALLPQDDADATDMTLPGASQRSALSVSVFDALDERSVRTEAVTLSPLSYDLIVQVAVQITVTGVDDARGRELRAAFAEALGAAIATDRSLGGVAQWAEIADGVDPEQDYDAGGELRAEILAIDVHVSNAATARG
jgi:hypothetical protein